MIRARTAAIPNWLKISAIATSLVALFTTSSAISATALETNAGLAAYQAHLRDLRVVVADCKQQRTLTACDPSRVGPDEKVTVTRGGRSVVRQIRYDWLRVLLENSGGKASSPTSSIGNIPATTHQSVPLEVQLQQAQERLSDDAKAIEQDSTIKSRFAAERQTLASILAAKEYKLVTKTTLRERVLNWLTKWIDRILDGLIGAGAKVPWLARVLEILFIAGISLALVWMLIRIERRSRLRLTADLEPGAHAPSVRGWQLWLADAHTMAGKGAWREAIHLLYWASISRLESNHVWPADRARTPREYLRLVQNADPRKQPLKILTRSFERIWYGGQPADSEDYGDAVRLAEELGVK
jgi:hypothetical protein